jgi:hypothetical protein
LAFILCSQAVPVVKDFLPGDLVYLSFVLPAASGVGFMVSFADWLFEIPRVEVTEKK